jgi:hypothetical protein
MAATIKRGDKGDILTLTTNADLTGWTPVMVIKQRKGTVARILNATVSDDDPHAATHTVTEPIPAGVYDACVRVTRGAEGPFTFPTKGYETFTVESDLG